MCAVCVEPESPELKGTCTTSSYSFNKESQASKTLFMEGWDVDTSSPFRSLLKNSSRVILISSKYSCSPIRKGMGTTRIPNFSPSSGVIPEPESVQIPIFIVTPLYSFRRRLFPVISFGCGIPISSRRVGATSARHPPSLKR